MATFFIYRLDLFEAEQQTISKVESSSANAETMQAISSSRAKDDRHLILEQEMENHYPKYETGKDKDIPQWAVYARHGQVTLLTWNEERVRKTQEGKITDGTVTDHPGTYIVIDNRPNMAQIAIEGTSADKADTIRDRLETMLRTLLKMENIDTKIRARVQEQNLWDIVEERIRNGDSVKNVIFYFPKDLGDADKELAQDIYSMLETANRIGQSCNAYENLFSITAARGKTIEFEQTKRDIAQLVRFCCAHGYDIHVRFKRNNYLYRSAGKRQPHVAVDIDKSVTDDFISAFTTHDNHSSATHFALIDRMDDIYNYTADCTNETSAPTKRKKRH